MYVYDKNSVTITMSSFFSCHFKTIIIIEALIIPVVINKCAVEATRGAPLHEINYLVFFMVTNRMKVFTY